MSTRDAYKKKIEAEMEWAQAKLVELKAQATVAATDVRIKYSLAIEKLEHMLATMKVQLKELGSASEDAWEELVVGVDSALTDLKVGIGNAADKFNG